MNRIFSAAVLAASTLITGCGVDSGLQSVSTTKRERESNCSPGPAYADTVIQATGASGVLYGDPHRAVNGVRGTGQDLGSTDVFSLDKAQDGALIVRWSNRRVCNGPGADFNVFENGFITHGNGNMFFEAIIVSVSLDGTNYQDFPHQYLGTNSPVDAAKAANWQGFAGMHPVLYNEDTYNLQRDGVNPLDPSQAGGDVFDLDNLPDTEVGRVVKANGFRFMKFLAAPKVGFPNVPGAFGGYGDVDGVYAAQLSND